MHIWTELLLREGAFLALLLLLGSGPAAYLSDRFDAGARLALAPILGFCVGSSVTTTILQFAPANSTFFILGPLGLASASLAAWRVSRAADARSWRACLTLMDLAQLALVCLVVAGPLTYSLHKRHTVGPAAYTYTDVDGYVAEQNGAMSTSTGDASSAWRRAQRSDFRFSDLTQYNWGFRADFDQNLDAVPLEANFSALLGLGATETFSPFLIVLLLTGALGVFAGVRYVTRSRTWAASLAGGLFGGPFFLELYYDTYQAAICGLALMMPLVVLAGEMLRTRRTADLILCALVLSGFLTVYPLFVPLVVAALAIVLAGLAIRRRRAGGSLRSYVRPIGIRLLGLGLLAAALEPVAFVRDVHYARAIINNTIPLPRVGYALPLDVLPGWLLQTREFWNMQALGAGGFKQLVLGALIPLCFVGLIVFALWRYRSALVLVVLAGACALVAEYTFASRNACTYCAARNLLPLAPIGAVLIGLGVSALLISGSRTRVVFAVLGAALVTVAVAQRARVELERFVNSSYFLDSANRAMLSKLPRTTGLLQLEGYDASFQAQAEEALTYFLATEQHTGKVSLVTATNEYQGLAYLTFGNKFVPAVTFSPNYGYVLTRFGGVRTERSVIARSGGTALEERARPLDVTPIEGLAVPLARLDPSGIPWVQPHSSLVLYVTGIADAAQVWASLTFRLSEPVTVPPQPGVRTLLRGKVLTACVPATGSSPLRIAMLRLSAQPVPGPVPEGLFPPPVPLEGIALTGMRAVAGACSP